MYYKHATRCGMVSNTFRDSVRRASVGIWAFLNNLIRTFLNLIISPDMGYAKKNLKYIVVSISLYVSIISILIGVSFSSLIIYFQNKFQIINLPSEKIFQLTFLPAHFDVMYFIKYPIFLILFTILISLYVFNRNFKIYLKWLNILLNIIFIMVAVNF